jgi:hypothetical protein
LVIKLKVLRTKSDDVCYLVVLEGLLVPAAVAADIGRIAEIDRFEVEADAEDDDFKAESQTSQRSLPMTFS